MSDPKPEPDGMDDLWAAALREQRESEQAPKKANPKAPAAGRKSPQETGEQPLKTEETGAGRQHTLGLELLLRIPVEVRIRLGDARLVVNDLMQLGQGSIIELDKLAGNDLDLLVNDRLMGKGEVVVVNDRFGLRITEILPPSERIRELG